MTPCRLGAPARCLAAIIGRTSAAGFDTATQQLVPIGPIPDQACTSAASPVRRDHIGHANTYVAFDLLNRVWRDRGLEVNHVQNVTDIDDPLLERAAAIGIDWAALAEQQTKLFW